MIAGLVAGLVEEGDRIMLDASSTSLMIAKELKEMKKLTVITNSVEVLIELAGHDGIQVISTGGNLNESSLSLVGNAAQKVLNGYHVDKAIFSCKGIDMKEGMTDSNELDSDIKIAMYGCADTAILAVDSSKFDRVSFVKSMMLKTGDVIVTDRKPSAEWLSFLEEPGGFVWSHRDKTHKKKGRNYLWERKFITWPLILGHPADVWCSVSWRTANWSLRSCTVFES